MPLNTNRNASVTRSWNLVRISTAREIVLPNASQIVTLPILTRGVDSDIVRQLDRCMRDVSSAEIRYMSMNDSELKNPRWRRITPHTFSNDGAHWYIRAFCHTDIKFKDFVLSRFMGIRKKGQAGALQSSDHHWTRYLNVILIANPKLSKNQRRAVALEYEMKRGRRVIPVRHAALFYLKKRLRLDTARSKDTPTRIPVCIENCDEVDEAIKKATR